MTIVKTIKNCKVVSTLKLNYKDKNMEKFVADDYIKISVAKGYKHRVTTSSFTS